VPDGLILAQMARAPVPGEVKTRLLPALSAEAAAQLHEAMLIHTCRTLLSAQLGPVELWVSGDADAPAFRRARQLGISSLRQQSGLDLGQRMAHLCGDALQRSAQVILVGSDAPAIDSAYLEAAAQALQDVDAVLGPALDGGYVLLALRRMHVRIFEGIRWGGDEVLAATLDRLREVRFSYQLLPALPDIDRPEDLRHLPEDLRPE
jgi:rSAM/selenodomain-associated transferase 1